MPPGFTSVDSTNYGSKRVFSIHDWEFMDAEGQLYALFYAILYKDLSIRGFGYQ